MNPDWRWDDEEQALLTSCSSLIAIVETDDSRVVQFSHFSVKEFLTSTQLADSSKDVSCYHIDLESAHMVLAQACMAVLLQPDDFVGENSSLARYAARHWPIHAQFKSVSSSLKKAMEYLFNLDMPHFATWVKLHNRNTRPNPSMGLSSLSMLATSSPSNTPLYYAALYGFQDHVEHLVIKHPQHVNTSGGSYGTPLVAALVGRNFQTAKFLDDNGACLDVLYKAEDTLLSALHSAAWYGDVEMIQVLLGYEVEVNARRDYGWTPLHDAASYGSRLPNIVQSSPDVARILLDHGADINARIKSNSTPLHIAAGNGSVEVACVLLEHGAHVGAEDEKGGTPLHKAARNGNVELVLMLLQHSADINVRTNDCSTPLLIAAENGSVEVVQMLIKHGVNADAEDEEGRTLLHGATRNGSVERICVIVEHGADINAWTNDISTALLMAATHGHVDVMHIVTSCGVFGDSLIGVCLQRRGDLDLFV